MGHDGHDRNDSDGVNAHEEIVGHAMGLHLRGLRDGVVVHLILTKHEYDEGDAVVCVIVSLEIEYRVFLFVRPTMNDTQSDPFAAV